MYGDGKATHVNQQRQKWSTYRLQTIKPKFYRQEAQTLQAIISLQRKKSSLSLQAKKAPKSTD